MSLKPSTAKLYHPASHEAEMKVRNLASALIVIVLAMVLIGLNVVLSFGDHVALILRGIRDVPTLRILINVLCAWLVLLLGIVFSRWREITSKHAEMEAVISSISPDVLLVVSPDRTVRLCNESVLRIFGYAPEEILGKPTDLLYGDRRVDRGRPREIYDILKLKGFHYGIASGTRKDGSLVPLEIITGELVGRGGAVLLVRDITERVEMETHRQELEERARRSERLESLGLLAGGIAHDFNNLLTLIQGHADLMLIRNQLSEDVKEGLGGILRASERAHDLCQNLMSFAGRRSSIPDQIAFGDLVRETVNLMKPAAKGQIQFDVEISAELPLITGDATQLRQVVMNVLVNAVDAMKDRREGGIRVKAGVGGLTEAVMPHCLLAPENPSDNLVFLVVRDEGCGMSDDVRLKVCEPFFSTKQGGHGMGMAAVSGILRSHRGGIAIESAEGQGTTISIFLPVDTYKNGGSSSFGDGVVGQSEISASRA